MGTYGFSGEKEEKYYSEPPSPESGVGVWLSATLTGIFAIVSLLSPFSLINFVMSLTMLFSFALFIQSLRFYDTVYRVITSLIAVTSLVNIVLWFLIIFQGSLDLWFFGTVTYGGSLLFLGLLYDTRSRREEGLFDRKHVGRTGLLFIFSSVLTLLIAMDIGMSQMYFFAESDIVWSVVVCMVSSLYAYSYSQEEVGKHESDI